MRSIAGWMVVLAVLAASCGDGDDTAETPAPSSTFDTASAATCEDLADAIIVATQEFLDVLGDASLDEYWGVSSEAEVPPLLLEGSAQLDLALVAIGQRNYALGCDEALDDLICERQAQLEPRGPAGEGHIRDNTPCGLVGTLGEDAGNEADARIDAWLEERSE